MISQKIVQQELGRREVRFGENVPDRETRKANWWTYETFMKLFDRIDYMGGTKYYFDNIVKETGDAKKWGGKHYPSKEINDVIQAGNKFYRLLIAAEQALQRQWDRYQKDHGTEGEAPEKFTRRYH